MTLNALQVVSLATKSVLSGIRISGNKPFAAFSGNMCGNMVNSDACGYAMVRRFVHFKPFNNDRLGLNSIIVKFCVKLNLN